jgi:hypothetical protein
MIGEVIDIRKSSVSPRVEEGSGGGRKKAFRSDVEGSTTEMCTFFFILLYIRFYMPFFPVLFCTFCPLPLLHLLAWLFVLMDE